MLTKTYSFTHCMAWHGHRRAVRTILQHNKHRNKIIPDKNLNLNSERSKLYVLYVNAGPVHDFSTANPLPNKHKFAFRIFGLASQRNRNLPSRYIPYAFRGLSTNGRVGQMFSIREAKNPCSVLSVSKFENYFNLLGFFARVGIRGFENS